MQVIDVPCPYSYITEDLGNVYLGSLVLVLEPLGQRIGMEGGQCTGMEGGQHTGMEGGQHTGMEVRLYTCDVNCHQVEGGIALLWAGMVGRRSLGHTLQENVPSSNYASVM